MKSLKRGIKALILTVLAYLIQTCVMNHLTIRGVSGSVIFAVIAVLTVSCGKKYAFCASCLIGVMVESMLSNVPGLYVIAYPVIAMLSAQAFADRTDRQLEQRRMRIENRKARLSERGAKEPWWQKALHPALEGDLPAHLRIPLCAGLMDLLLNIVLSVISSGSFFPKDAWVSFAENAALLLFFNLGVLFFLGRMGRYIRKGGCCGKKYTRIMLPSFIFILFADIFFIIVSVFQGGIFRGWLTKKAPEGS